MLCDRCAYDFSNRALVHGRSASEVLENPQLRDRAAKLGAAGFLNKPFDATTLADAIETALSPVDYRRSLASGE